jgi:hypothetical protein
MGKDEALRNDSGLMLRPLNKQRCKMAANVGRPETGIMQFGKDWSGVYIRGDNARGFLLALSSLKSKVRTEDWRTAEILGLGDLMELLSGSYIANLPGTICTIKDMQYLQDFDSCKRPSTDVTPSS